MPSSSWRLIHDDGGLTPARPRCRSDPRGTGCRPRGGRAGRSSAATEQAAPRFERGGQPPSGRGGSVRRGRRRRRRRPSLAEEIAALEREAEERGYEIGRNRAEAELRAAVDGASAWPRSSRRSPRSGPRRSPTPSPSWPCRWPSGSSSTRSGSSRASCAPPSRPPSARSTARPRLTSCSTRPRSSPSRQAWEALHGRAYLGKKWFFEGDPTLPVGGCTLRYEHGFVEAGLEAQLEEIGIALDRAIPNLARGTVEEEVA
jgi:hypothetical protein